MAKKRYKYSFTKKRHSRGGIESSVFALASCLIFLGASVCSLAMKGNGGMYLGAAGLVAIGLSVIGFILGLRSFSEENKDFLYSKIGSVSNGVLMVIWLALFLVGIS